LSNSKISKYKQMFDVFFRDMATIDLNCDA